MFRARKSSTLGFLIALISQPLLLQADDTVLIEDPTLPNVVLITSDQLGLAELQAEKLSPFQHLSRLHSQSHKFSNFYINPAVPLNHASLYTGRYNIRTKTVDYGYGRSMMAGDEVTISEILGGSDYKAGFFGTWWLGNNFPLRPSDRGFSESFTQYPKFHPPHEDKEQHFAFHNNAESTLGSEPVAMMAERAAHFARNAKELDHSFFLNLNIHSPAGATTEQKLTDLDLQLGALFAVLDELKLNENTLIIFTSTLGFEGKKLGFRGVAGSVYEAGVRAPLWILLPKVPNQSLTPKQIKTISAQIDIMPTIMDFCQFGSPEAFDIDGVSLLPAIHSTLPYKLDRPIVQQHHRGATVARKHHFMLRHGDWKLINPSDPSFTRKNSENLELYNLNDNPSETNNLAAKNPKKVKELLAEYNSWFDDVTETRIRERGISPILVSRAEENPLILMEDTRISKLNSDEGFWKLQAEHDSRIDVSFDLPAHADQDLEGWIATVSLRGESYSHPISKTTDHAHLTSIPLKKGRNILQVQVSSPDQQQKLHPKQVHLMHR